MVTGSRPLTNNIETIVVNCRETKSTLITALPSSAAT